MLAITLTAENKIHSQEEVTRFSPKIRNGFQKGENGNYYKVLGDPRCISYQKKKEELERKKKIEDRIKRIPKSTKSIVVDYKFDYAYLRQQIKWIQMSSTRGVITLERCRVKMVATLPKEILEIGYFVRIDLLEECDMIKFWVENKGKDHADFVLYSK